MTSDARICFVIMPFSKTQSATEEEWTQNLRGGLFGLLSKRAVTPAVDQRQLGETCSRASWRISTPRGWCSLT